MAGRKKLTANEILDLDVKAFLRGAVHRFGGCDEFGRQFADLCAATTESESGVPMPTGVPDSIRMQGMKTLAALLGQHGDSGASSGLVDAEALEARLAMLNANPPPLDDEEDADGDLS